MTAEFKEEEQKTLQGQGIEAAKRYLAKHNCEIINENVTLMGEDSEFTIDLIAKDNEENDVVFVNVDIKGDVEEGMPKERRMKREDFERIISSYFSINPDYDRCGVRYDTIALLILSEDKALLRHHKNVNFE